MKSSNGQSRINRPPSESASLTAKIPTNQNTDAWSQKLVAHRQRDGRRARRSGDESAAIGQAQWARPVCLPQGCAHPTADAIEQPNPGVAAASLAARWLRKRPKPTRLVIEPIDLATMLATARLAWAGQQAWTSKPATSSRACIFAFPSELRWAKLDDSDFVFQVCRSWIAY